MDRHIPLMKFLILFPRGQDQIHHVGIQLYPARPTDKVGATATILLES